MDIIYCGVYTSQMQLQRFSPLKIITKSFSAFKNIRLMLMCFQFDCACIEYQSMSQKIDYRKCCQILKLIHRQQGSRKRPMTPNLNAFHMITQIQQQQAIKENRLSNKNITKIHKISRKDLRTVTQCNSTFEQAYFAPFEPSNNRPVTCKPTVQVKIQRKHKTQTLFQEARQSKLTRLQHQKEQLLGDIFASDKRCKLRAWQDSQSGSKPNSLNLHTYNSLNKLMTIREEIYQTRQRRPQTGCERSRFKYKKSTLMSQVG